MVSDRTANAIILVVTAVWATNFAAPFLWHAYEPSESINAIFMAIVGGVFALKKASLSEPDRKDPAPDRDAGKDRDHA
jgi:hypothetical protein